MTISELENRRFTISNTVDFLERGLAKRPIANYFNDLGVVAKGKSLNLLLVGEQTETTVVEKWLNEDQSTRNVTSPYRNEPFQLESVDTETLLEQPGFLDQKMIKADVIIVSRSSNKSSDESRVDSIIARCQGQIIWPIVLHSGDEENFSTRKHGNSQTSMIIMPTTLLNKKDLPDRPRWLSDTNCATRLNILDYRIAKSNLAGIQFLQSVADRNLRRKNVLVHELNSRIAKCDERTADRELRELQDKLRQTLDDSVRKMESDLLEATRQRKHPSNSYLNQLRNRVEDLTEDDFMEERLGKKRRLNVKQEFIRRLTQDLREHVDQLMSEDQELISESMIATRNEVHANTPANLELPFNTSRLEFSTDNEAVREGIYVVEEYFVDVDSKNFFDRISHGRRPVFSLMMIASIVGAGVGLSTQLRAILAPVMLAVFLGAFLWTYFSFRNESVNKLREELARLRQTLRNGIQRTYEQVLRDWSSRATDQTRQFARRTLQGFDKGFGARALELVDEYKTKRKEIQNLSRATEDYMCNISKLIAPLELAQHVTQQQISDLQGMTMSPTER